MRFWPFHRCTGPSDEAFAATEQGKRARQDAERLHEYVAEVAEHTAQIRRQNNFGAAVEAAFRGG